MTPILDRVGGTARRVAAGAITTAVLTAGLALVAPAPVRAQEPTEDQAARQAAGWLASELEANDYVMPDFSGSPGSRDFGLTIDAFFVLAAAGVGGDVADRVVERIEQDGWQYTQWSPAHGSSADMGSYAKVALALQVAG
ncbi:hypothetical protein [Pimelobacter simplex]|uniref:hypothetical protein n=1 Tax=Nocardioides simplex TaxID=2045 RepID=UPI003AAFE23C